MIVSIGTDIIEVYRIRETMERTPRFSERIFTEHERAYCESKGAASAQSYAARFAAKEAFAKACGTGLRAPVMLSNISVLNDELGRPYFVLAAELQHWIEQRGIISYHLSLSDERSLSSAVVVFEK